MYRDCVVMSLIQIVYLSLYLFGSLGLKELGLVKQDASGDINHME